MSSHADIRWRPEGFERKCPTCSEWVALTLDDWKPWKGMQRCGACWRAYHAAHERGRTRDEAIAEAKREANRIRYHLNRRQYNESAQRWRDAHRAEIADYNRRYRAAHQATSRASSRKYYAEARDVILTKKRAAYRERAA